MDEIKSLFDKLNDRSKGRLNYAMIKFLAKNRNIASFLSVAANHEAIPIAIRLLCLFMHQDPDLREQVESQSLVNRSVLKDALIISSCSGDESTRSESLIVYILRVSDLLFTLKKPRKGESPEKVPLITQFDWTCPTLTMYARNQEFWLNLVQSNFDFYKQNTMLLPEHYKPKRKRSGSFERDPEESMETGSQSVRRSSRNTSLTRKTARGFSQSSKRSESSEGSFLANLSNRLQNIHTSETPAPAKPKNVLKIPDSVFLEAAVEDAIRWKIRTGEKLDKLRDFCEVVCDHYKLKKSQMHGILVRLEHELVNNVRLTPAIQELDKSSALSGVFVYLDPVSGKNLISTCKQYYKTYRPAFIKATLRNVQFNSRNNSRNSMRLYLWEQLVPDVVLRVTCRKLRRRSRLLELHSTNVQWSRSKWILTDLQSQWTRFSCERCI